MIDYENRPFTLGYRDVEQAPPPGGSRGRGTQPQPGIRAHRNIPDSVGRPPSPGWSTNSAAAGGGIYQGAGLPQTQHRGRGAQVAPNPTAQPQPQPQNLYDNPQILRMQAQNAAQPQPAVPDAAWAYQQSVENWKPDPYAVAPRIDRTQKQQVQHGGENPFDPTSVQGVEWQRNQLWRDKAAAQRAAGIPEGPQAAPGLRQAPRPARPAQVRAAPTQYDEAGMQRLVDAVNSGAQFGRNANIGDDTRERARLWLAGQGR